jgi:hypothetical protein
MVAAPREGYVNVTVVDPAYGQHVVADDRVRDEDAVAVAAGRPFVQQFLIIRIFSFRSRVYLYQ